MIRSKNIPYYLVAFSLFVGLKFLLASAETKDLIFILYPTDVLVGLFSNSSSVFHEEMGYFYQNLNIIIDKSCSGYNLWLLSFLMLSFLALQGATDRKGKIFILLLTFFGSFIVAVLINSFRIVATIFIQRIPITQSPVMHEAIGIIINLTFLILIYLITERLLFKTKLQ